MMNANVAKLLNEQINKELYSAYLYLEFANHFDRAGLDGFANWYKIQAREEQDHAMLFYQYLQDNGQPVTLEAIEKPAAAPDCHRKVLLAALKHEELVTSLIHALYKAASDAGDYRTMRFLDWFIEEQGEEEQNANALINKMELFGGDAKGGLYLLNQELAGRSYSAPSR